MMRSLLGFLFGEGVTADKPFAYRVSVIIPEEVLIHIQEEVVGSLAEGLPVSMAEKALLEICEAAEDGEPEVRLELVTLDETIRVPGRILDKLRNEDLTFFSDGGEFLDPALCSLFGIPESTLIVEGEE